MSSKIRNRTLAFLALPALLAFGCASTSTTTDDSAWTDPPKPAPTEAKRPEPVTIRDTADNLVPVYFETDRAELRVDARAALKRYAKSILDNPEWGKLTIAGHCDERGSDEYNLALGRRRAAVVERYLMDLGVPASRLDTRSFGEEKPAVAGHNEDAWRYNRRSEFKAKSRRSASR